MIQNINASVSSSGILKTDTTGEAKPGETFSRMLDHALEKTAESLEKADQAVLQANTGGPVALHDVMIAMEKADISLRLLVQVRNKALDAYQEIMRMQV